MTSSFHSDLRVARWLPSGVGRPLIVALMRKLPMPSSKLPAQLTLAERRVEVSDGGDVRVRVIGPRPDGKARPALLWIHGGGYVIGSAKQDDALCARFAERLDMVVVNVDYRLAPQQPFPTPVEDCFAAFEHLHANAAELGIDPARVVIGGQSAGAGLAAGLALLVHDRQRPAPVLQLLVYPMIDDRTVLKQVDGRMHRMWDQRSNAFGWRSYLGREPGEPGVPGLRGARATRAARRAATGVDRRRDPRPLSRRGPRLRRATARSRRAHRRRGRRGRVPRLRRHVAEESP